MVIQAILPFPPRLFFPLLSTSHPTANSFECPFSNVHSEQPYPTPLSPKIEWSLLKVAGLFPVGIFKNGHQEGGPNWSRGSIGSIWPI